MKQNCYICGLERSQFEKDADGFTNHIERDHQAWNYIFFLYYLDNKDYTEMNGYENDVLR